MATDGAAGPIASLRRTFLAMTYGISEELGPKFTASSTQQFLRNWGLLHRLSSVTFPHSNTRTELAMKTVKRMLVDNTDPNGSLNTNLSQRVMLQYRNTPDPDSNQPLCCKSGWKITLIGSCFTLSAESRYSPVEGEALVIVDAWIMHVTMCRAALTSQ